MSHFFTLVLVKNDGGDIQSQVEDLLAPYDENIIHNPDSKWDWWVIGGRWTGKLDDDYDPYTDPRNIVSCTLCGGTGDRPGWVYYEAVWGLSGEAVQKDTGNLALATAARERGGKDWSESELPLPPIVVERRFRDDWAGKCSGCNGCNGTGKTVKWSLAPFDGDVVPVSSIPENTIPFALVTPDGAWHERGSMGWFACVSKEKEKDAWENEVKSLLTAYQDCIAVVCDLHI